MRYMTISFDFELHLILNFIIKGAQSVAVYNAVYNDAISTCVILTI